MRDDRPLMVMVTRLTRQKGMDLVTYALDRILSGGVQVAILGTGDYEEPVRYFANKYPGTCAARITFDNALSHRMYAGADLFLMPSLFEPCGLSQMIAMRYGTLPVVRETGGLRDTVQPYNQFTGEGTGFTFANFNGEEMGDAVFRGARLFWDDRAGFDTLVKNAMSSDFSWAKSAHAYIDLFRWLRPDTDAFPPVVEEPKTKAAPKPVVEPVAEAEVKAKAEEPKVEAAPETEAEATVKTQPAAKTDEAPKAEPKAETKQEAEVKPEPEAKPAAKKRTTTRKGTATKTATSTTKTTASKSTAAAKKTTAKATTAAKKTTAKATTSAKKTTAKATSTTKAATAKKATASKTTTSATRTTAAKKTATTTTAAAKTAPVAKQAPEAASAPAAAKPATEKADATAPRRDQDLRHKGEDHGSPYDA